MLVGIKDGECDRDRVVDLREMMVGDDEVEAESLRRLSFGKGPHARIDSDHQAYAIGIGGFEHGGLQAVALAQPMRHMKAHLAAEQFDCRLQKNNGSGAVDVVVSVQQDGLFARDGCFHAFHRGLHAQHQQRIVQLSNFRIEKREGFAGGADAARDKEFSQNQWNTRCLCECFGFLGMRICQNPTLARSPENGGADRSCPDGAHRDYSSSSSCS